MTTLLLVLLGFVFAACAARQIGFFSGRVRLPLITGYLAAGAVAGPHILNWISREAVHALWPVDDMALAFIAFAAGSELYMKEIRSRLRSIGWSITGQLLCGYLLTTTAILLLGDTIPFLRPLPLASRVAVALMASAILVARSPSSAIAIISELRARGVFTKTTLGVIVVMDGVVIVVFALSVSAANALVSSDGFRVLLLLEMLSGLALSLGAGWLVSKILELLLPAGRVAAVLVTGLGVFGGAKALSSWSAAVIGWHLAVEPLLVCMFAGFLVANFGRTRDDLERTLVLAAPVVYVAFFTLVGASLALGSLSQLGTIALALCGVRLVGIALGSVVGGAIAGDAPQHQRLSWMAYVTQAGVSLGLTKEAAVAFPAFGAEFATLIVAVIVINQLVGPPLHKLALKRVGEAHLPGIPRPDEVRDALILGVDDQSLALARRLVAHNWKVIMADRDAEHVARIAAEDVEEHHIFSLDDEALTALITPSTDAVVAMLASDEDNHRVCQLAYEKHGIKRIIVRLRDLTWSDRFAELGAHVVEPASAMVNLFDQYVRAPNTAALLLHRDPEHEVSQITIDDPDLDGLPLRDLRLPLDVRVLEIVRDGHSIVPHGHTELRVGDEVTFVGDREHLEEIVARWGY